VTQARQQGAVGDYAAYWDYSREDGSAAAETATAAAAAEGTEAAAAEGSSSSSSSSSSSAPRRLAVRQRVAAFLNPQDPLYFDVGGKAVALYDYSLQYELVTSD